ncbi:MAG: cell wall biosynthesis glycosyltransferase [Verrucomicrobia bacterium]|nr:MAG: cell wall biosynthesis glycosyltransferase [Verrucomicrobiota bacterium]
MTADAKRNDLELLSVVIPARDEEGCIASTVEHLHRELRAYDVPNEIVVVDDGSSDRTWKILEQLKLRLPNLAPTQNTGLHGFGRAVIWGLNRAHGDAVVIMMADESDDVRDVIRYWNVLNEGYDCAFGSRFMPGGGVVDYPRLKFFLNRVANKFLQVVFRLEHNDITNAFKAYRKTTIDGCRPLRAAHFNLTIEIPLKAVVRAYTWKSLPITWRNRRSGHTKLKIKEIGSGYVLTCLSIWLEKCLSRGKYRVSRSRTSKGPN